jgi:hypothetical protein
MSKQSKKSSGSEEKKHPERLEADGNESSRSSGLQMSSSDSEQEEIKQVEPNDPK